MFVAKIRIKFSKVGQGSFISHLDLTRLFTRALTRAKVKVKYTSGFNPHAFIVFTPPLSLGYESDCELVDFEVEDDDIDYSQLKTNISVIMPQEINIIDCYEPVSKFKDIGYSEFLIKVENQNIKDEHILKIKQLFEKTEVEVLKKSKKGESNVNIIEKIKNIDIQNTQEYLVISLLIVSAPDDTLNPEYILKAIKQHLEIELGFALYKRLGFYTKDLKTFL